MPVTRCIGPAIREASRDPSRCKAIIDALPEVCPHADCTPGGNCRERVAEPLRVAWRAHKGRRAA